MSAHGGCAGVVIPGTCQKRFIGGLSRSLESLLEEVLGFGVLLVVGEEDGKPLLVFERVGAVLNFLACVNPSYVLTQFLSFRVGMIGCKSGGKFPHLAQNSGMLGPVGAALSVKGGAVQLLGLGIAAFVG